MKKYVSKRRGENGGVFQELRSPGGTVSIWATIQTVWSTFPFFLATMFGLSRSLTLSSRASYISTSSNLEWSRISLR